MKREGRQHGMVRTYRILPSPWNPRPESRFVQQFDSPPTAGLFTKVLKKPTNHSKFTGRCGKPRCLGCHMHLACKAKNKTKGSHKLRSSDMTTNYRLITWRAVDGRPGLKFSGCSATSILDHLSNDYEDYYEGNDDRDYDDDNGFKVKSQSLKEIENDEGENTQENIVDHSKDDDDNDCLKVNNSKSLKEIENDEGGNIQENIVDHSTDDDDDESVDVDNDVKFVLNQNLEEEGWCLVGEI